MADILETFFGGKLQGISPVHYRRLSSIQGAWRKNNKVGFCPIYYIIKEHTLPV